jgi:hypothetical protein
LGLNLLLKKRKTSARFNNFAKISLKYDYQRNTRGNY